MAGPNDLAERLLIEPLSISGRFAVLDEVTTRLLPHSFATLDEAERYVEILVRQSEPDPERAAAAVERLPAAAGDRTFANWVTVDASSGDPDDAAASDDDVEPERGWATVAPDNARLGGALASWMTTYPHRRADTAPELADHLARLRAHGHSFALVSFAGGRIVAIGRVERSGGLVSTQSDSGR